MVSRNPSPDPNDGNQPSCTANTAMSTIEATNDGIAPRTVRPMSTARSSTRPRLSAATMPPTSPTTAIISPAMTTRPSVTGSRSPITVVTSCRYCSDRPKSPCSTPPSHCRYCCQAGRSSPYCAVTCATASGVGLRPRSRKLTGSPGTRKREKNTSNEARNSVRSSAPSLPATRRAAIMMRPPLRRVDRGADGCRYRAPMVAAHG